MEAYISKKQLNKLKSIKLKNIAVSVPNFNENEVYNFSVVSIEDSEYVDPINRLTKVGIKFDCLDIPVCKRLSIINSVGYASYVVDRSDSK